MAFGVDFSFARPGIATLKSGGATFVVRYLYPGGKGITASEYASYKAAGIAVAVVYEGNSGGMKNGTAQGVADAKTAAGQIAAVGLPASIPVYFTADWDATTASDLAAIDAYLNGAATVLTRARVGIYGGLPTIRHVQASKTAIWFWQTYAWSGGGWAAGTHLQQYLNGQWGDTVDFCRSMTANFGQDSTASFAGANAVPISFGDDMKIFQATNGTIALIGETFGQTYSAVDFDEQANAAAWGPYITGLTQDQITTLVNDANARGAALKTGTSAMAGPEINYPQIAAELATNTTFLTAMGAAARAAIVK